MSKQITSYSEFGYYIHRVERLLNKRGDEQFKSKLGISLRQFLLLRLIEEAQGHPSQQALAERLGIAKSAVSRHVEIAQQKGWIEIHMSSASKRMNELQLTPKGQQLLAASKELIKLSEEQGFGDLPPKDVEATLRVLKSLYDKLVSSDF